MDGGRAQAVFAGAGPVRQGRLAEHLAQLRHLADADAGGESRAEVLHPPQLHEPGPAPLQHPRHHQRHRGGTRRAAGPDHRPRHGQPRHGAGAGGHEAPRGWAAADARGGHVRGAHGPPRPGPHGVCRRRHAGHVPAGARALRRAGRLPGAPGEDALMTTLLTLLVLLFLAHALHAHQQMKLHGKQAFLLCSFLNLDLFCVAVRS